jgi:4-amino-4-deoxy-L-arabinose transferase-like glycosyltransferase
VTAARDRRLSWRALSGPLAIALAIAAQLVVLRRPEASAGLWLYAVAIAVLLSGGTDEDDRACPQDPFRLRDDALPLAVLLVAAAALRLILITRHPGLFGDEGERGMEARKILEGGRPPLAGYGWWGVPNVYFYLVALCLRVAGDGVLGLRLLSVVSGVAAVFFVARAGALAFGRRVGLIAGALLAVSPVALQFSRLAGESTPTGALWAGGFFFVLRAVRFGLSRDALLAGFLFGSSLYFYASARLLLLLVPVLAVVLLVTHRGRGAARLVSLLVLTFGVTYAPLAATSFHDRQAFAGRYEETSIFSPQNRPIAFASAGVPYSEAWRAEPVLTSVTRRPWGWARVLFHQVSLAVEVLFRRGEPTVFYQPHVHLGSLLSPLLAPLALLGLAWGLRHLRDERFAVVALWFWGGLLGPVLTINTPSVQRLTGAWPALFIFPAILLDRVASRVPAGAPRRLAPLGLAALVGTIAFCDVREYFVSYRADAPYGDATAQARHVAALGSAYRAYQLGVDGVRWGDVYFGYGPTRFLAKGVEGGDVGALPSRLPIVDENGKGAAFLVYPSNAVFLPMLRLFYPEGRVDEVRDGARTYFTSFRVDANALAATRVLRAVYRSPNGESAVRPEPNLGTVDARGSERGWSPPDALVFPARTSWEGALLARDGGATTVTLNGGGDAALEVDGRLVARESGAPGSAKPVAILLAKGLHDVHLTGTLAGPRSRITAGFPRPPEPRLLFRSSVGGLTGDVWSGEGSLDALPSRVPEARRVDPFLGFRNVQEDVGFPRGPFLVRWRGALRAPREGVYGLGLRSNGASRLLLDGRVLLDVPARGAATTTLTLDRSSRDLEVRYSWSSERPYVELTWTLPGGAEELVAPTFLTPEWRSGPTGPDAGSENLRMSERR